MLWIRRQPDHFRGDQPRLSSFTKLGLPPADTDHRRVLAVLRYLNAQRCDPMPIRVVTIVAAGMLPVAGWMALGARLREVGSGAPAYVWAFPLSLVLLYPFIAILGRFANMQVAPATGGAPRKPITDS